MLSFLAPGGSIAAAIATRDWSTHALGSPDGWPTALRSTLATVLGSRFPQCVVWGEQLYTFPNDAFMAILGEKRDPLGRPFDEVWSEAWGEIGPIVHRAFAGEPTYLEDFELDITRSRQPETAWFTFCYSPIRDDRGKVVGMLDTVIETTDSVLARRQSDVLTRELVHRVKNALSVAQAIAVQSMRGDFTLSEARDRVQARLGALAQSHDVLLTHNWDQAGIADVVTHVLRPHAGDDGQWTTDGPDVLLSGRQALSLALALHELATNAAKYGALLEPGGHIDVIWALDGDSFTFDWRERGGPPVSPPSHAGFGSRILTRVLPADLGGQAELDYPANGLHYRLVCPAGALSVAASSEGGR